MRGKFHPTGTVEISTCFTLSAHPRYILICIHTCKVKFHVYFDPIMLKKDSSEFAELIMAGLQKNCLNLPKYFGTISIAN